MRKLTTVFLLLLTTQAWAFRARPVSDLRFDGRAQSVASFVASDGRDFLVLSYIRHSGRDRVFTQKIVDGRPAGPHREIAFGSASGLVWTGNEYLAAWTWQKGLWTGRVSRDGSLVSEPVRIFSLESTSTIAYGTIVANGQSILAGSFTSNGTTVQPLDVLGRPAGAPVAHPGESWWKFVAASGSGFAVVQGHAEHTALMLLRADGTAITPSPVVFDGPTNNGATVASDGTDTVLVLGGLGELKSVVFGPDGTVKSRHTLHSFERGTHDAILPRGIVWDGSRYLVAVALERVTYDIDVAMMSLSRSGERISGPTVVQEKTAPNGPRALAWNGRELLLASYAFWSSPNDSYAGSRYITVNPATMTASPFTPLGRALGTQRKLTIAAGQGGYLAAWFDDADGARTIRASRIDRHGNYLDGDGIVLGTGSGTDIAIAGDGPHWLVVWSTGQLARGRVVSRAGVPAANTIALGTGHEVDVRWNGSHWVVLRSDYSLHRDLVDAGGVIVDTKLLAEYENFSNPDGSISYEQPVLLRLGNETVGVYTKWDVTCPYFQPGSCIIDTTVQGLRLEDPNAAPFVITKDVWDGTAVASSPSRGLVTWSKSQKTFGVFLSASAPAQPGTPFVIEAAESSAAVAFDGTDFIGTWWIYGNLRPRLAVARISDSGAIAGRTEMDLDDGEYVVDPVIAASTTLPPLVGFQQTHPAYDDTPRAALLFASEIDDAPAPPPAPSIVCATTNGDGTISVRWQPMPGLLGFSVELELADGTFRQIAVAPGGATGARVSRADLEGDAVRVRAWNAGGLSAPSSLAPSLPPPSASLRSSMRACAATPVTIGITLSGTAPFTVRWSDGFVQSNLTGSSATRSVTVTRDTTFSIVSVADASCAVSEVPESIRITVDPRPAIEDQTREVRVTSGQTATLSVDASDATQYAWFEGAPGDVSRPAGGTSATFTTPALTQSTRYWVRVSNRCGGVDSAVMNVVVSGKRRSVRR